MPPVSRLYSTTSTSSPVSYSDGSGVFGADRSYLDPWDLENYAYLRRRYSEIEEPIVSLSAKSDFYYVSPDAYFQADNPGGRMNRRQSVMVPEQNHGYELAGIEEEHFSNQCLVDYERVPGNSARAPQPPKTKKCSRQHNLHNQQPVAKLPKQQLPPRRHSSITFDQYQQKIYYPTVTEDIYSPGSVDFRASDDIYWCPSVKRSGKGSQQLLYVYQTQKPARRPTPAPGPNTNYMKRMSRFSSCSDYQRLMPPPSLSSRYSTSERVTSTRGSTSTGAGSVTTSTSASTTDDPGEVGAEGRGGAEEADDLEMMGLVRRLRRMSRLQQNGGRGRGFGLSTFGHLKIDYSCNWSSLDRYIGNS